MRNDRIQFGVTPWLCVFIAAALCLLPLRWVFGWLLALSVHELGHLVALKACGAKIERLKLTLFGAEIVADMHTAGKEIICALAGPASGIVLLAFHKTLPVTVLCSFVHSVYNLLPLNGLDGGRALSGVMRMALKADRAERVCKYVDNIVRALLLCVALYLSWRMKWWILLLFVWVLLFLKNGNKNLLANKKGNSYNRHIKLTR